jgi:hypothetical protein
VLKGREFEIVAAGAFQACQSVAGEVTTLYRPHHWVDAQVAAGALTPEEAANHPLRAVMIGPFVADERGAQPEVLPSREAAEGARLIVTEERLMEHYLSLRCDERPTASHAIQALAKDIRLPPVPVVIVTVEQPE